MALAAALPGWIVAGLPDALAAAGAGELLPGVELAPTLQFAFAALLAVVRAIDVQVGFGHAAPAGSTTGDQMPRVGTPAALNAGSQPLRGRS